MKIEKEFKIFGNMENLVSLLKYSPFDTSRYVMHSNMHFTHNGKTVKLRIEYDINDEGLGVRFYKIIKEDINSKDKIKPKAETVIKLNPEQFIIEFKKFSKKVKGKNVVFYTLLKDRLRSSNKKYKNMTIDVCYFQNEELDINGYGLRDIILEYPELIQFFNKLNKSAEKLVLAQPYIEIESLSKNMTTSKLLNFAKSEIFNLENIFITDKSAATLAKIFHGQYNALRIKSDIEIKEKKNKKQNKNVNDSEYKILGTDATKHSVTCDTLKNHLIPNSKPVINETSISPPCNSEGNGACCYIYPPVSNFNSEDLPCKPLIKFAHGNDVFVKVGSEGIIYVSTDTLRWKVKHSNTTVDLEGICYGDNRFVAVGKNTILISADSEKWNLINISLDPIGITYVNNQFNIQDKNGNIIIIKCSL